ncbi:hypothetical protein ACSDQ9_12730 [Aestuariimicrobium soli]|uniref:hypothetical protein n=1 Tax=Aestuariimicrobium soli TaxID=2035834 RepID=UPI003EBC775F
MNRRRVISGLGATVTLAGLGALSACGAPALNPEPSPTTTTTTSTGTTAAATASAPAGTTLRAMGLVNGPADVTLPTDLTPVRVIDQPNVVTLIVRAADASRVQTHLEATLPAAGFTVDASSQDSLLFHDSVWDGAWTSSDELAGLTFRRRT